MPATSPPSPPGPGQARTSFRSLAGGRVSPWSATLARWSGSILLILAAVVVPYGRAGENGFVYDDVTIVQENPRVQSLRHVGEIFRTEYWNDPNMPSRLYRPVTLLSYAADRSIWGPAPGHYHRINVVLHALVSLLVAGLAALLLSHLPPARETAERTARAADSTVLAPAVIAGVLFAVHPLHSEVVAGIVGRAELLAALGALGAVGALVLGGRWRWAASPLACLALLSKESAVLLLPVVILGVLAGWIPAAPRSRSRLAAMAQTLLWVAPGVAVAAVLRMAALHGLPAMVVSFADNPMAGAAPPTRFATACAVFARYLGLHVWPARLSPDYSFRAVEPVGFGDPVAVAGLVLLIVLALVVIRCLIPANSVRVERDPHRRQPPPAANPGPPGDRASGVRRLVGLSLGWYLLGMVLLGNFVTLIGTAMAERLTYLPSVGLVLLVSVATSRVLGRRGAGRSRVWTASLIALVAAAVLVSIPRCRARTQAWRDAHTLFAQAAQDRPESYRVWAVLGDIQKREGSLVEARASLERAVSIYDGASVAMANLLAVVQDLGDLEAAQRAARRLAALTPADPRPHCVLALLLARAGDLPEAQRAAAAGLALHPGWRPLQYVAGRLAAAAGSPADAARYRAAAVPAGTDSTIVLRELGSLLVRSACWPEAADIYRVLYRHDKSWPTANALAWSLVSLARNRPADRIGLLTEARAAADAAVKAAPADARKHALDTLAAIQWEFGEQAEAMATMEALIRESPWEDLHRRRLETYRLQVR